MPTLRCQRDRDSAREGARNARAIPPGFVSFPPGRRFVMSATKNKTMTARAATFSDRRGQRPSVYASSEARLVRRRFGVSLAAAGKRWTPGGFFAESRRARQARRRLASSGQRRATLQLR
jgi:hypothetical protein